MCSLGFTLKLPTSARSTERAPIQLATISRAYSSAPPSLSARFSRSAIWEGDARPSPKNSGAAPRAFRAPRRRADDFLRALAVVDPDVLELALAGVDLPRPGDFLLRVFLHLHPLGDPACGAGDGEDDREHLGRDPHRLVDDPRVEVDVRVELALVEEVVVEGVLLQLARDLDQRAVLGRLEDGL